MDFTAQLLQWYKNNKRELPWRDIRDPYKTWLSEIILQQTRISQGIHYYYRFLERFPDVVSMAKASEDEVLSLWQGLGYYSRARNLHHTARVIVQEHEGQFPASYLELIRLKGIGPYTAAAIASIAFDEPRVAVDGNVERVIARVFGIQTPVNTTSTKKQIHTIAQSFMDERHPGDFNQAMMDFGATICTPAAPKCCQCPFFAECFARKENKIRQIPHKNNKPKIRKRFFHFFLFYQNGSQKKLVVEKRRNNDIWKNLYQLPLVETKTAKLPHSQLKTSLPFLGQMSGGWAATGEPVHITHQLTHQRIEAFFYKITLPENRSCLLEDKRYLCVSFEEFEDMGKPVLIKNYLEKYIYTVQ